VAVGSSPAWRVFRLPGRIPAHAQILRELPDTIECLLGGRVIDPLAFMSGVVAALILCGLLRLALRAQNEKCPADETARHLARALIHTGKEARLDLSRLDP
jgi:hypothetical protein